MLADGSTGAHGYQSYPLVGSPGWRLQEDTARLLGSGAVRRCPHPGEPAFWFLAAGMVACVVCTGELLETVAGEQEACQACGAPASAVAAWMASEVPCVASLCNRCQEAGLVPLRPN